MKTILSDGLILTVSLDLSEVDVGSLDTSHEVVTNLHHQIRQLCVARDGDTSNLSIVDGTGDLRVVTLDDSGVGDDQGGAGVSDGLEAGLTHGWRTGTDCEHLRRELPEALGSVDWNPGHGAVELSSVDATELVGTDSGLAQISGEDGLGERGHDIVEEGLLLLGLDGVQLAEGKTDETVVVGILSEGLGDSSGHLNGLVGHSGTTNVDGISSNVACSSRAITVADRERSTLDHLQRCGLGRVVQRVTGGGLGRKLSVENPQVGRARVEVEVQGLSTNVDRGQVLNITLLWSGCDEANTSGSVGSVGGSVCGVNIGHWRHLGWGWAGADGSAVGELVRCRALVADRVHQCWWDVHAVFPQRLEQLLWPIVPLEVGVCYPLDLEDSSLLDLW